MKKLFYLLVVLSSLNVQAQFTIPKVPSLQTSVYDYADVLNTEDEKALEIKLIRYADSTSTQIVLITIEDLKGEDIGILTPRWGQEWGIGGSEQNDYGVIILFSKNDRKIWISAGYGVEDRLTAGITGELTRNVMIPEFKLGNYYSGFDKGSDAIFEILKGKYKGTRKEKGSALPFILVIAFVVLLLFLASKGNKGGGNFRGGSGLDLGDIIILSSLGRGNGGFGGGGSFGGGSSGGFGGGFGGGGFSGGGAGGSW